MKLLQYAIRNTQYAIRNTQYAIRNYYAIIILLIFAITLSSCGLRSSDSSSSSPSMTGGGDGGTTPMTMTPPADTTPLPPTLSTTDLNDFTATQRRAYRLPIISATQNTVSGITQSGVSADSVSAVMNDGGLDFYTDTDGMTVAIRVENENADWVTTPPSLLISSYIFDGDFASRGELSEYENGDFYIVTGFWFRSTVDFGIFADGSPLIATLPTEGSATYRGNIVGYVLGLETTSHDGNFTGNIELLASFKDVGGDNRMTMEGAAFANIAGITAATFDFSDTPDGDGDGVFIDGNVAVLGGTGKWGGRFVGDSVSDSVDYPAGFVGTFSIRESVNIGFDILGTFGTIHNDLCGATTTLCDNL